jgi:hypothetical protein
MVFDEDFDPNPLYDAFPSGPENGFGPDEGFGSWVKINDESLFTEAALENPVIKAFVTSPMSYTFARFKSSTRESEYYIHKPELAMTGQPSGIVGTVPQFPTGNPRIATLVVNHERTLAKKITSAIVVTDDQTAGQLIYKGAPGEGD